LNRRQEQILGDVRRARRDLEYFETLVLDVFARDDVSVEHHWYCRDEHDPVHRSTVSMCRAIDEVNRQVGNALAYGEIVVAARGCHQSA
jgi:hypothetical protein